MNKTNFFKLMMVALVAVLVTACDKDTAKNAMDEVKKETKSVTEETSKLAKDAVSETEKAVESATDWTKERMTEYSGKMNETFKGFSTELKDLGAKAESMTGDVKIQFEKQFSALTDKQGLAAKEMKTMETATGDAWSSAKGRFEKIMEEIKVLYDKMISEFTGK